VNTKENCLLNKYNGEKEVENGKKIRAKELNVS
jgi:hypothetical protein